MKPKYHRLNKFRLKKRLTFMGFTRLMADAGYPMHWAVIRRTLRGETEPRDFNEATFDEFMTAHKEEFDALLGPEEA